MASAFSMISRTRRTAFSEGKGAVSVDLLLEALFAYGLFHNIYCTAENRRQSFFEILDSAEVIEARLRKTAV